jgi:hypothetical protein
VAAQEDRSKLIAAGTVDGLLAFCDWLEEKRYASSAAVGPWKSAIRRVFEGVEGDGYGSFDVRGLDLDGYMRRFENAARGGTLKAESVAAYGKRVRRALDAYEQYLEDGRPPQIKQGSRRTRAAQGNGDAPSPREPAAAPARAATAVTSLIDYPFPLANGEMGYLRLPRRLGKSDAERIAAFVRTLVLEPQLQIEQGRSGEEE